MNNVLTWDSKSEPFDAWIPYLAANIFNLYVCREKVDHENERTIDLITLSCLSIAWKSREKDFSIRMLKAKYKKLHTITQNMCLDMEFQILDALGSTPRSLRILTPIIFSHYFASIVKMNYSPHEHDALFCEIIVQCQSEYWVAKLRPSLIAALGALVISTLFSLKVFNKFYKALEKNQFITEDEFICYFPEMLKLFQKLKIDKEHRQVFDFPIKWKNNIKCASRFLIFTNMRIIECSPISFSIASQGVGIMPKSSLILKAISLIMILGSLYCIIKIINERWETKKTSSQLLRMNKYVIGVAVNDEDVDDSDDLSADDNDDNWYLAVRPGIVS
ncbi:uncharacterized protein LOC133036732 [Cannabis sativa]|uniref:uncharacterized protein LOC133036732 n=1 Tax=Cannabis sativa TaxID=3483 RepID=UPI0029C9F914|nr:uncharacterized protein LOC133036732 [Cannabis sativa]